MSTADRFQEFAAVAAAGGSPIYADWAGGIAGDPRLVEIVDAAPAGSRQPVLVLAVCRILGAQLSSFGSLRAWMLDHADALVLELGRRLTQTNDVRRSGPVALALASAGITGPIALLEVGASAGLGLYPDRFALAVAAEGSAFTLGNTTSDVRLATEVAGPWWGDEDPTLPRIEARLGLDLQPLAVTDDDARLWLETLLRPGQEDRVDLLRAALRVAVQDPPTLVTGDAVDGLEELVARTPRGLTPVVVSTGTLVYLPGAKRQAFVDLVTRLGVRWIAYERTGLLSGVQATVSDPGRFEGRPEAFATLSLDGVALAVGDAHGTRVQPV